MKSPPKLSVSASHPSRVAGGPSRVSTGNEARMTRAWKLSSAFAKNVSPQTGPRRFELCTRKGGGRSSSPLPVSATKIQAAIRRIRRQQGDTVEKRADRFGLSGCRVKPRRPSQSRRGFHTTAREPKRGHFRVPAFKKHHQNSTKGPQERERRMKTVAGEGKKKSEILGSPAEGCPVQGCLQRRVVQRFGVQGSGFRVKDKMKSENKKKEKKSKRRRENKRKKKKNEETEQTPSVRLRPINFDFGQFRLRPAGRSGIIRSRIGQSRASSSLHSHPRLSMRNVHARKGLPATPESIRGTPPSAHHHPQQHMTPSHPKHRTHNTVSDFSLG